MPRWTVVPAAVLAAVLTATAAVADISRVPLIGPAGDFHCGTGEILAGRPGGFGSVVLRQRGDEVSAIVQLRRVEPRTTFHVRLVQISEDQADCHFGATEVVSNAAGRLVVRLEEPVTPTAIGFNVAVNTGTVFGAPHWVGARMLERS